MHSTALCLLQETTDVTGEPADLLEHAGKLSLVVNMAINTWDTKLELNRLIEVRSRFDVSCRMSWSCIVCVFACVRGFSIMCNQSHQQAKQYCWETIM
jgi:hypothetical protein